MTDRAMGHIRLYWQDRVEPVLIRLKQRPLWLAALAGFATALVHPPFGFLPGLFGYALLLWVIEREAPLRPWRTVFLRGWLAGFVYFLVGCYWVVEAFLVFAESYGWMAPFALVLLPGVMGLFWAIFAVLYRWIGPRGVWRFVGFAALFALVEVLRGWVLGGFPWNPAGASWAAGSPMSQIASLTGVYGLSFFTVALFASLATVGKKSCGHRLWGVYFSAVLLVSGYSYGLIKLYSVTVKDTPFSVRIVQPNVSQREKWTPQAFRGMFNAYVDMSGAPSALGRRPDVIIWPEGAFPTTEAQLLSDASWTAPALAALLAEGQSLIMGVTREESTAKGWVWRNSLMVLTREAGQTKIAGYYNKHKLVPFGEYTPGGEWVKRLGLRALNNFVEGFTPGDYPHTVALASIPRFQPLICFESIFPHLNGTPYTGAADPRRPRWIVNASNDAWFGHTSGPRQHLNLASYRAIEEGLPMVRSTPTGVSGLIDPLGRMVSPTRIDQGEGGYRDFYLPQTVDIPLFARIGNELVSVALLFILLFNSRNGSLSSTLSSQIFKRREPESSPFE